LFAHHHLAALDENLDALFAGADIRPTKNSVPRAAMMAKGVRTTNPSGHPHRAFEQQGAALQENGSALLDDASSRSSAASVRRAAPAYPLRAQAPAARRPPSARVPAGTHPHWRRDPDRAFMKAGGAALNLVDTACGFGRQQRAGQRQ
jgi:hypothetical protein